MVPLFVPGGTRKAAISVMLLTVSPHVQALVLKGELRIAGLVLATVWALGTFLIVGLLPYFPLLAGLLFFGQFVATYLTRTAGKYAYAGVQMGLVLPMLVVAPRAEFGSLTPAVQRLEGVLLGNLLVNARIEPDFGRSGQMIFPAVPVAHDEELAGMGHVVLHLREHLPSTPDPFGTRHDLNRAVGIPYQDTLTFFNDVEEHARFSQMVGAIEAGTTFSIAVHGISRSPEASFVLVDGLYQRLLGRSASGDSGAGVLVQELESGVTEEQVIASIAGSQEFYNRAAALTNTGTPFD